MFDFAILTLIAGIVCVVALYAIRLIRSHTKNQHLLFACNVAEQVVISIQKVVDVFGATQKEKAYNELYKRLSDNGYAKNFTEDQVKQIIETAEYKLQNGGNANGSSSK